MPRNKRFVYILESLAKSHEYYVGLTSDPESRLRAHNGGLSRHTATHRPWKYLVVAGFEDAEAAQFERYLKTGSGREFARRHCRQTSSKAAR